MLNRSSDQGRHLLTGFAIEYGHPTPECIKAIKLAALSEGLVLDPVYTGKAMGGLGDLIRRRRWRKDQTVVFWHTGG